LAELIVELEDAVGGGGGSEHVVLEFAGGGEGGEDIFDVVLFYPVEQEEGGVELGHQVGAFGWFEFMDAGFEIGGLGQWDHIITGAGEFENPVGNPFFEGLTGIPGAAILIEIRVKHRQLFHDIKIQMNTTNFLTGDKIKGKRVKVCQKATFQSG